VFAETSVGGYTRGTIIVGQGKTGDDGSTTWAEAQARVQLTGQNEEGTFGAQFRFGGSNPWKPGATAILQDGRSRVWWKPIDILTIQLGSGLDGSFGIGEANTGWGFYGGDADWGMWKAGGDGFGFGGRTGMGLYLSVKPISNLDFNMILPFGQNGGETQTKDVEEVYKKFYAEVAYKLDNVGTVKAGFQSDTFEYDHPAGIGISFDMGDLLKASGLGLAFQVNTKMPSASEDLNRKKTYPLKADLGASFTAGDFQVKFRVFGQFFGQETNTATDVSTPEKQLLQVGLYPNFKVSGNLLVGIGFDVRYYDFGKDAAGDPLTDTKIKWHTSPVVQFASGPGKFQVGLNVGNDSGKEGILEWGIPIMLNYNF